jgi:thiamine-monophosphate kinase
LGLFDVSERIANETELIQTYLAPLAAGAPGAFGLKDDAALIEVEPGFDLVVSTDPVIASVHFFSDDAPGDIAWKALAVNVSDLVAKGAEPFAYTMALALPEAPRRDWMAAFSAGLRDAQTAFGCMLIGGDTDKTTGPLSIGITAFGKVPRGQMVRRAGAKIGDHVFVSGSIGDSALGLKLREAPAAIGASLALSDREYLLSRYLRPQPRVELAPLLRQYASAALDVSDGLMKDAARLAAGAGAALNLQFEALPLSVAARAVLAANRELAQPLVSGGDDYEILFAVAPQNHQAFFAAAKQLSFTIAKIGVLTAGAGVSLKLSDGSMIEPARQGYDHFQAN